MTRDLLGFSDYRHRLVDFSRLAACQPAAAPFKKDRHEAPRSRESAARQTLDQPIGAWPMPAIRHKVVDRVKQTRSQLGADCGHAKTTAPEDLLRRISVGGLP